MTRSAPRIPQRLLDAVDRLDDRREPLAEIARPVAAEAERLGLTRPSYERLRQLIHQSRAIRARRGPSPVRINPVRILLEDSATNRFTPETVDRIARAIERRSR
jgi:hypothetical protein